MVCVYIYLKKKIKGFFKFLQLLRHKYTCKKKCFSPLKPPFKYSPDYVPYNTISLTVK